VINTDGKQRQGSGGAVVDFAAKGAKRAKARKTQGHARARMAPWAVRAGEIPSQATPERLRGRAAARDDSPAAGAAVADLLAHERRRMAADVHDLIMQDLALGLATARMLADDPAQAVHAGIVVAACERALAAAREMIDGLLSEEERPVVDAVGASARAAARLVPLRFCAEGVPTGLQPDQPTLDAVVHVAREAVTNAVKHAEPSAVEVVLEHRERWRLLVHDDGCGFDSAGARRGFGLNSMSAHTSALGGLLRVTSMVGAGTTVEAILP
jgi:signal transduction histidine kinase